MRIAAYLLVLTALGAVASPALAQNIERGRNLAHASCARCHSIDKVTPSAIKIAPPFRDLHKRYPVESLEESLAEGVLTGHPTMPEYRLEPDQIGDFIAFLKSLEK